MNCRRLEVVVALQAARTFARAASYTSESEVT